MGSAEKIFHEVSLSGGKDSTAMLLLMIERSMPIWCTGKLKTHLINKEVNRLKGDYHALHYVGIAADEPKRIKNKQYPLVDWGITEAEVLKMCYDHGYDWG